jgi:hypothetical protein
VLANSVALWVPPTCHAMAMRLSCGRPANCDGIGERVLYYMILGNVAARLFGSRMEGRFHKSGLFRAHLVHACTAMAPRHDHTQKYGTSVLLSLGNKPNCYDVMPTPYCQPSAQALRTQHAESMLPHCRPSANCSSAEPAASRCEPGADDTRTHNTHGDTAVTA